MMRSTCLGEMRNCRAMTEGLTPASNAARISLRWPAERLGGCLCALDLGAAPRLDGGAFGDRERFAAVVDGRGRRRCASALTARNSSLWRALAASPSNSRPRLYARWPIISRLSGSLNNGPAQ